MLLINRLCAAYVQSCNKQRYGVLFMTQPPRSVINPTESEHAPDSQPSGFERSAFAAAVVSGGGPAPDVVAVAEVEETLTVEGTLTESQVLRTATAAARNTTETSGACPVPCASVHLNAVRMLVCMFDCTC